MTSRHRPWGILFGSRWNPVLEWVVLPIGVVCLVACLLAWPCIQPVRVDYAGTWDVNNVMQIGWAFRAYHEAYGRLPPAAVRGKNGQPLLSWRVLLLPYLEQDNLYSEFHLDEPWDGPHNKPLLARMPKVYGAPGTDLMEPYVTYDQVLVGPGTAFERNGLTWDDFPDGLANTLLVVAAGDPVPWTKPEDLVYDPAKPLPRLGHPFRKSGVKALCCTITAKTGFLGCCADGSVHFIRSNADEAAVRALITRDGGEKVDLARLE